MLQLDFNAPILLKCSRASLRIKQTHSTRGRAAVIDSLMPQLSIEGTHRVSQYLRSVDDYMLFESRQLLSRLALYCQQLNLSDRSEFELRLEHNRLICQNNTGVIKILTDLANKDRWSTSAFSWLLPNYLGLVHSLEMLHFATLYQHDKQKASSQYEHFEQQNQGLRCKLIFQASRLHMCWESPRHRFYLPLNPEMTA